VVWAIMPMVIGDIPFSTSASTEGISISTVSNTPTTTTATTIPDKNVRSTPNETQMAAKCSVFCLGNPLLDIQVLNGEKYLEKYGLKSNDAILAEEKHMPMCVSSHNMDP
jgi:hypothetical protein